MFYYLIIDLKTLCLRTALGIQFWSPPSSNVHKESTLIRQIVCGSVSGHIRNFQLKPDTFFSDPDLIVYFKNK